MRQITSKDNRILREARQLGQKKYRDETGQFLAEGWHLLEEAEACGLHVPFVIFSEVISGSKEAQDKAICLAARKIPAYRVSGTLFRSVSGTESPQGLLAAVHKPKFDEKEAFGLPGGNWLVLDRLQDPGNVGTMIRTAEAAGMAGVIVMKGTADLYAPKVVRAAAGSIFRMPVFFYDQPAKALQTLKSAGKQIAAALPEAGVDYDHAGLTRDTALIIGSEAQGVCEEFRQHTDIKVRIPMRGKTESLNAAVAAGILMYEGMRSFRGDADPAPAIT